MMSYVRWRTLFLHLESRKWIWRGLFEGEGEVLRGGFLLNLKLKPKE